MADLRERLEQALFADPDDRAAHAAYADLLSEDGDPRGEFIQVQLALEEEGRPAGERKRLQEREFDLLTAHGRAWLGDLARYVLDQKGVSEWRLDAGRGCRFRFARGWLDLLHIVEVSTPLAEALGRCPFARLLRELRIEDYDYDHPGFDQLVRCGCLGQVRRLQLGPEADSCHMDGACVVEMVQ
jgi:uncharacterized protein (TIGR02996 family)